MRLQRHGSKKRPFYFIVVADARAPRDGKFISKIGTYNPLTVPSTIQLDRQRALDWLHKGAQPTDTCRAILSYKGVMYRNHLQGGVVKGALTQEQADAKFAKWISEKDSKIVGKVDKLANDKKDAYKKFMATEAAAKEAKAAKIVAKNTPPPPAEETSAPTPEAEAPQAEAEA